MLRTKLCVTHRKDRNEEQGFYPQDTNNINIIYNIFKDLWKQRKETMIMSKGILT